VTAAEAGGTEIARLRALLAARPPMGADLAARRAGFEAMMARIWDLGDLAMTPATGDLAGTWVDAPGARPDRVILYLHGGAFMVGSPRSFAGLAGLIGAAASARVLVLDNPLAPEHPVPAAPDAAARAHAALIAAGHDPARIAFAGDSAGANLALGAALAARDGGRPLPAAIACISAYLDMTHSRPSIRERSPRDPFVALDTIDVPARLYAPDHADRTDPRLSPIFADLRGLPPMLLLVGEDEAFHDDSVDFAAAARQAGCDAVAEVWPAMVHVWPLFAPMLAEGRAAADRAGRFLGAHLAGASR
jgi:acetyl esterase/lipase